MSAAVTDGGVVPALRHIARHYGLHLSEQTVRAKLNWSRPEALSAGIAQAARDMGLSVTRIAPEAEQIDAARLPLLVVLPGGTVGVIEALLAERRARVRLFDGRNSDQNELPLTELIGGGRDAWSVRPLRSLTDARVDRYLAPVPKRWLRETLFPRLAPYWSVIVASLVVNTLTVAGVLFSMQVYDRVIPAKSLNTLAVLLIGVVVAMCFEFFLRITRARLMDVLGKHAGLRLSDHVFARALRIRSDFRPQSTGSFISQIRDIDTMRETLASTAIGAVVDVPFFLLFCALFWYFAGWMVVVPLAALVLMLAPGLLVQRRLRDNAQSAQREAARRNAVLVEAVQGMDDIKGLQAEEHFESVWRDTSLATADKQFEQKRLVNGLTTWTQVVQSSVYAGTVAVGAPLVMDGTLTTGTLVAASILGTRMLAPMGQLTGVLARIQQARVGGRGLDQLMQLPIDLPEEEARISRATLRGAYDAKGASYKHRPDAGIALVIDQLAIRPGERIGLLGRNGAGKSTLLQALSGQLLPTDGALFLDGVGIEALDPADVRRDVAYLSQSARLFFGTLRENIAMGHPMASDDDILRALTMAGSPGLVNDLGRGLDQAINEGGVGLSGGQRQTILLARMLLRNPRVLLLDEPSSAMDDAAERALIKQLSQLPRDRTMVIATHRLTLLDAVDRLVVIDHGRVVLDGPKQKIMAKLGKGGGDG
ncbi:type I secretion system permease/ATPase [Tritonibacter mobilis]|uniref:type I secretion system permease/ATPase n=1 Tax=Tritonibacter mobilis TaxID=379347 RepID=UPI001962E148|nr:type I secretion system permease/ATPase [Tritonibacter mobilis]